jgi:outer membrane receptor protein involved in Fe transport
MIESCKWIICALGALAVAGAHAADSSSQLDEIVVTAQKRQQNLQDVGISVAAFDGEKLREAQIESGPDVLIKIPNIDVYSGYGAGASANIVIRGVGLNDFGDGHEAPVTTYVDEAYTVAVPATGQSLYDLERVEVLRGPQGTIFGSNSIGGLVNYITAKPTDDETGFVTVTRASFNQFKAEGAVSGAIGDGIDGRVSFLSNHSGGYETNLNPNLPRGGADGTDSVRLQLAKTLESGWKLRAKVEGSRTDEVDAYFKQTPIVENPTTGLWTANPAGTDGAGYNEARFGAGSTTTANTNDPQRYTDSSTSAQFSAENTFDTVSFKSLSNFMHFVKNDVQDCDASPNDVCDASFPYQSQTVSQEFRLSTDREPLRWTAGVYLLKHDIESQPSAYFNIPISGPTAVNPATGLYNGASLPIALAAHYAEVTKSGAVFGQIDYEFSPIVSASLGARVTRTDKDFADYDNAALRSCPGFALPNSCFLPPVGTGIPHPYHGTYAGTLVDGKAELDIKPVRDLLLYASVSRGTKAGGFNNGFYSPGLPTSEIPYGAETLYDYEGGIKSTLAEGRVRLNADVFSYDYRNFQAYGWTGLGGVVVNRPARQYGAEGELDVKIVQPLTARLSAGYLHTRVDDITNSTPTGNYTADREMANAPHLTVAGGLDYVTPLPKGFQLRAGWDFNYVGARFNSLFNDPATVMPSYSKHNVYAAVDLDTHWSWELFVKNVGNEQNLTKNFVFSALDYVQRLYAEPRVFGVSVNYKL